MQIGLKRSLGRKKKKERSLGSQGGVSQGGIPEEEGSGGLGDGAEEARPCEGLDQAKLGGKGVTPNPEAHYYLWN